MTYRRYQAFVTAENIGLEHGQLRVTLPSGREEARQIDSRMESIAQQHRNYDGLGVPVGSNPVQNLVERRCIEVEKRQPDIEIGPAVAKRRDSSRDHPSGSGITAAVRDSD